MKLTDWSVNADTIIPESSTMKLSIRMRDSENPFLVLDEIKELIKRHNTSNQDNNQDSSCDVKHFDSNICLQCENCTKEGNKYICNYDGQELLFDKYAIECDKFKSIYERNIRNDGTTDGGEIYPIKLSICRRQQDDIMTKILAIQYPKFCPFRVNGKCSNMFHEVKCTSECDFPDECPLMDAGEQL